MARGNHGQSTFADDQQRDGKGGAGVVAAWPRGGVVTRVEPAAGDGALDTSEPGGGSVEAAPRAQAGAAATPPAAARQGLRNEL
jgi:hypothetical protein